MKYETFPLTAAEKLHLLAVQEFSSQVVNIGVCMSLKASLDFGLLKKMYPDGKPTKRQPASSLHGTGPRR